MPLYPEKIMTISIVLQFVVVLAAIWMGARYSGVGLGLWGAVGLLVLVVAFAPRGIAGIFANARRWFGRTERANG